MTTASITLPRTASTRTVSTTVGPITAFWTEMLAAWNRTNEIEFQMRSGR